MTIHTSDAGMVIPTVPDGLPAKTVTSDVVRLMYLIAWLFVSATCDRPAIEQLAATGRVCW